MLIFSTMNHMFFVYLLNISNKSLYPFSRNNFLFENGMLQAPHPYLLILNPLQSHMATK